MSRSWFHGQRCACVPQRGPTEQPRAGGCGRTGRTRGRTRSGARPVAGGPAHARTNIQQYDSFIIRFISIHLLNNFFFSTFMITNIFFSVFLQISHQDNLLHNNLFCSFHLQKYPSPLLNLPKQCKICQVVVLFQYEPFDIDL